MNKNVRRHTRWKKISPSPCNTHLWRIWGKRGLGPQRPAKRCANLPPRLLAPPSPPLSQPPRCPMPTLPPLAGSHGAASSPPAPFPVGGSPGRGLFPEGVSPVPAPGPSGISPGRQHLPLAGSAPHTRETLRRGCRREARAGLPKRPGEAGRWERQGQTGFET